MRLVHAGAKGLYDAMHGIGVCWHFDGSTIK
jgi:hypothetical protein